MPLWQPDLPDVDDALEAQDALVVHTRELLRAERLTPNERLLTGVLRRRSPRVAAAVTVDDAVPESTRLVLSVEIESAIRLSRRNVFRAAPGAGFHSVATPIVHAAANAMEPRLARILADLTAHDFVEFLGEQRAFAAMADAPADELRRLSPGRYGKRLREIHRQMRDRALPLLGGL